MRLVAIVGLVFFTWGGIAQAAELPSTWQKGANVGAFWWKDLDDKRFPRWMARLRANGTDSVTFAVPWYQDSLSSTELKPSYGSAKRCKRADGTDYSACKTPSMASLRKAIERARALGMKVGIKPLVEVGLGDSSAKPRNAIDLQNPGAVRAWFDSYKNMLSQYAKLARDAGADRLVIGTGLNGMTDTAGDQAEWRDIVAETRDGRLLGDGRGGFAGKLTYAANWNTIGPDAADPALPAFFWDALDEIGIEGYFPLVPVSRSGAHDNPSRGALADGWSKDIGKFGQSPVDLLRALNKEYGKPVVMTGMGYLARGGTSARPSRSDGEQARVGGKPNEEAQLRPYQAAFDVWGDLANKEGWFQGIYWWQWEPGRHRNPEKKVSEEGGFSPQGRSAELELCRRQGGSSCRITRVPE